MRVCTVRTGPHFDRLRANGTVNNAYGNYSYVYEN